MVMQGPLPFYNSTQPTRRSPSSTINLTLRFSELVPTDSSLTLQREKNEAKDCDQGVDRWAEMSAGQGNEDCDLCAEADDALRHNMEEKQHIYCQDNYKSHEDCSYVPRGGIGGVNRGGEESAGGHRRRRRRRKPHQSNKAEYRLCRDFECRAGKRKGMKLGGR